MHRFTLPLLLAATLTTQMAAAQSGETPRRSIAHIGFVYPLSTNGTAAPEISNSFSFHALAGVGASETGFALSGITNVIREEARGFQLAGISNHTGHSSNGIQIAGIANTVGDRADGMQLAGIANTARQSSGLQLAGIVNVTAGTADGLQMAGLVNHAGDTRAQIAGFANVAGDVDGIQIAGFINRARVVRGVQIAGFINIADSCDAPIGLINIVRNGELAAGLSIDESGNGMVSFRSGGRVLYCILAAGRNFSRFDDGLWALEAGLGAHLTISRHFRINLEGSVLSMNEHRFRDAYFRSGIRLLPAVTIGRHLEIFAGPSFNQEFYTNRVGQDLRRENTYVWRRERRDYFNGLYFGGIVGLQVRI